MATKKKPAKKMTSLKPKGVSADKAKRVKGGAKGTSAAGIHFKY